MKITFFNYFENIMEYGAFAQPEQILHCPQYFEQPSCIEVKKCVSMETG